MRDCVRRYLDEKATMIGFWVIIAGAVVFSAAPIIY